MCRGQLKGALGRGTRLGVPVAARAMNPGQGWPGTQWEARKQAPAAA